MKNIKRAFLSIPALAMGLFLLPVSPAHAADALAICAPGVPYAYPGGGANILWNPDQGVLGPLSNAQAVAAVDASFDRWEDLPQSSVTYFQGPALAVDIDVTNYGPVLNQVAPNGESEIVFDADGSIFAELFGPGSGILGFAGPDFGNPATCELLEGSAFLNGPTFTDAIVAEDIMVHEFGHYTNLGHVELNGQLISFNEGGDDSGPTPDNATFGAPSSFVGTEVIETMYPFYFSAPFPGVGTRTPHADDIASIATIYPDPSFASSTGSISGTIYIGDTTTRLSGVNVIARRLNTAGDGGDGDLSFTDAVSTFSGAYTDDTSQADPNVGVYTLNNLTPGATYAVFIDTVTAAAGRFSNPIVQPLPGPEDYWDSAEAGTEPPDDPLVFTGITVVAGSPNTGIDIRINQPGEGDPLPVGDDGSVQLALPFPYEICGQEFGSVFVNANGNLTFGEGNSDFSESSQEMLDGPPRIAGLWDDLNPTAGGSVYYTTTDNTFTVTYEDVPEWFATGSNTFSIELKKNASQATVNYGDVGITDGLAGVSCGLFQTGGVEPERDLTIEEDETTHNYNGDTAIYELFTGDNDLANYSLKYNTTKNELKDQYERRGRTRNNNSVGTAAAITTPFNTAPNSMFTEISPAAGDVDWFSFTAEAGQTVVAEVTRGQIDAMMVLVDSGLNVIAFNDDQVPGVVLLPAFQATVPADGTYFLGVTFFTDFDFDGEGPGQGAPFDEGRYVLDVQVLDGIPLTLGDDDSVEVPMSFNFDYQGSTYSSVFVNSNGNLTFGSGDTDFSESVGELLSGQPRIAPLWDDLSPNQGGMVLYKSESDSLKVTFNDVPQFLAGDSNNMIVTLYDTGEVDIEYGNVDATDGIAGVTEGGVASDPGETDLSAAGSLPASGTTYEAFDGFGDDNDLDNVFLDFNP